MGTEGREREREAKKRRKATLGDGPKNERRNKSNSRFFLSRLLSTKYIKDFEIFWTNISGKSFQKYLFFDAPKRNRMCKK